MPTVAIVGAGFSGTMTAVQLARQSRRVGRPLRIVIIEPSGKFGSGVAYGTRCTKHVLNVPAGNMSALPEEPGHFVQWTRAHGISDSPDAFVPRYWYGVYLHDLLEEARHEAHIERHAARVMDILPDESNGGISAKVVFDQGEPLRADRVILAGGNFPPSDAQLAGSGLLSCERYLRDPWRARALQKIGTEDDLLMVGTGLTMLDVVVQLRSGGHRGRVHAVSRRGLVPQPHRPPKAHVAIPMPKEVAEAPRTAAGLLRAVKQAVRRLAKEGVDWRDVVASLRSHTVALWTSLDERERGKFLRHVRPYWDTHRHRIPLDLVGDVEQMILDGMLTIHRARIAASESRGESGVRVTLRPRAGEAPYDVNVAWVINCTGPDSDIRRVEEPLWKALLARGVVRPDPHAIGVVTASDGALIDRDDKASRSIYLVGPLRKAQLWESTAVPELRVQAADVARTVLASLPVVAEVAAAPESAGEVDHFETLKSEEGGRDVVPIYAGEYI